VTAAAESPREPARICFSGNGTRSEIERYPMPIICLASAYAWKMVLN
jgi:hypothetical protein